LTPVSGSPVLSYIETLNKEVLEVDQLKSSLTIKSLIPFLALGLSEEFLSQEVWNRINVVANKDTISATGILF